MFEHHKEPLLPSKAFFKRLMLSVLFSLLVVVLSLVAGMVGYCYLEGMSLIEAFHEAAMVFTGQGPVIHAKTWFGKLFVGAFAIYSAFAILLPISIVLAPLVHRFLHKFHLEDLEDE